MRKNPLLAGLALFLASLGSSFAADGDALTPIEVVQRQFAAFNRHDAEGLTAGIAEDFVWYAVTSDATTVESQGREKFREGMIGYFKSVRDVSSTLEGIAVAGAFVSFRETVTWTAKAGKRSQSGLAVYEVHDGLITRVWYYPASR